MLKFTREEKIVIIFLLASLFAGTAAVYFRKTNPATCADFKFDEKKIENSKKVNINEAGMAELIKLKHIGPVTAGRIISYRKEYGPFERKEDLKNIKGIGEKTYEKIKEQILMK